MNDSLINLLCVPSTRDALLMVIEPAHGMRSDLLRPKISY